jgi:hypothetical protein
MENKLLYIFLVEIIIFIVVILGLLFVISSNQECSCNCGQQGDTQKLISSEQSNPQPGIARTSENFDDKYFEYLEHMRERKDIFNVE